MPDVAVSPAGMRIIRVLVGRKPVTVAQLIEAAGVTRTAVTEQLNELIAAGFVERSVERLTGRGRPRHVYRASHAALLMLFTSNQHLVVPAIWDAIREIGGNELSRKVLKKVARKLADHYRPKITGRTAAERLRQFARALSDEGHLVEIAQDQRGRPLMRKRSCAFISMFEDRRTVCEVDQEVLAALVDGPIRRIACRHDGQPCCVFQLNGR